MTTFYRALIVLNCVLLINDGFAQVGQWTWMSGDSSISSVGHYGIQKVPDIANYPPAVYEPCDWQDQQGNFWVFGGFHNDPIHWGDMADLWRYNPNTNEWTWMKGSGIVNDSGYYGVQGVSSPLNNPACRGWGTPTWSDYNGNLWLYGGNNNCADLWKYNIANGNWTWMKGNYWTSTWNQIQPTYGTFQVPAQTNTPGNRNETSASWTDANGNLWLFGGQGYDSISSFAIYNDLWKYDVSLNQWAWMNGANYPNDVGHYGIKGVASPLNRPSARFAYAKWKDQSGNFYMFGGLNIGACGTQGFNDVWKYDIGLNNWIWIGGDSTINDAGSYAGECVTLNSNEPRNSTENRSTCYNSFGDVFMFGSIGAACSTYTANKNEFWHYSIPLNEWTLIMQDSPVVWGTKGISSSFNAPPKTFGSLAWYRNNEVWIFGGSVYGNSNSYNCLWKYSVDTSCFPSAHTGISNNNHHTLLLSLTPNPATTTVTITLTNTSTPQHPNTLTLYDLTGRALLQQQFTSSPYHLNIASLKSGMYIIEIMDKEGRSVKGKVVKREF